MVTQEPVNVVPVANAGTDQAVVEGTTVRLDGSSSTDPDQDTLTYSWSHDSTLVKLNGATTANPSFVVANVAQDTPILFTLTVSDRHTTASDTVIITVQDSPNSPPTVDAGNDKTVQEGTNVPLAGTASDCPKPVSYTHLTLPTTPYV